jgi:O-methyltransferase
MKYLAKRLLNRIGAALRQDGVAQRSGPPQDASEADKEILRKVLPYTMTSVDRLMALIEATRYICTNEVPGAVVECGVWRGGSAMAAMLALSSMGDCERDFFLYDTFEGMSEPTADDVSYDGTLAATQLLATKRGTGLWCKASLEDVQQNVSSTRYPESRIHLVRGDVAKTIPATLPGGIALLRLDTDWYESTKHELQHLFPLLHPRGILIVDDYGHWKGARKAVDEFFLDKRDRYYFHRIDYTGRLILRTFG